MPLSRNKLYATLFTACAAGYAWTYFAASEMGSKDGLVSVCLIKHATSLPCPACGSTRALIALWNGNFLQSVYLNPFGLLVGLVMLLSPLWILADLVMKKTTLLNAYQRTELLVRKRPIAITLICLVAMNWLWNIEKGL